MDTSSTDRPVAPSVVPTSDAVPVASQPTILETAVVTQEPLGWEHLIEAARELGPDPRFADLSDAQVRHQLGVGAAAIAAATCRWLELLAELVVRGVWADEGARTPGAWLSWALGIAPTTARDHVRVALRLRSLPRVRDRFAGGTLSYSKVRAITRMALPEDEELLLMWADHGTAAQLEEISGRVRSSERARRRALEEGDAQYGWRVRVFDDGIAELVVRAPIEEITALENDVERLAEAEVADRATPDPEVEPSEEDPQGAHDDLAASAVPRVGAADRARALATVVAAGAADTPVDTSGLDRHTVVVHVRAQDLVADGAEVVPARDDRGRIRGMDRATLRKLACEAGLVLAVGGDDGSPLDVGRRRRRTTAALRRAVHLRDRGCTFPGCGATRHLHAHHVEHWADGGATDLANLALLCGFHHRTVHRDGWRLEVRADGRHRFTRAGDVSPLPRVPSLPPIDAEHEVVASGSDSAESLLPSGYTGEPYDLDTAVAVLRIAHQRAHPALAA